MVNKDKIRLLVNLLREGECDISDIRDNLADVLETIDWELESLGDRISDVNRGDDYIL